jgi:UDP-N-acetylglucosamine--N-acetylmuramyl-(pentapeptide) pyrophosphoryl-undecaprenol N-acetylglucosamine transferase
MSGLRRGFTPKMILYNLKTASKLFMADFAAGKLLKRFKPDVVIGTGGYICYPVLKKAARMKIPTVVHDSNAIPGLTTKLVSRFVDKVLVSFPNQTESYRRPERVIFTGTPVREGFKTAVKNQSKANSDDKPLVLSFWGSLGAENMNGIISDVIKINAKLKQFNHIHVAGSSDGVDKIRKKLRQAGINDIKELQPQVTIKEYMEDMPSTMAQANLVLCRGGGSTVAELIELSKPAIIIPSPYVANNEQNLNAMELIKAGGAIQLDEKSLSGDKLFDVIESLLSTKDELDRMSGNLKSIAAPNATAHIVDIILSLCKA